MLSKQPDWADDKRVFIEAVLVVGFRLAGATDDELPTLVAGHLSEPKNIELANSQYEIVATAIRSAYRRGRAAGMRDASKRLHDCGECDASDHEDEINELADKIEEQRC